MKVKGHNYLKTSALPMLISLTLIVVLSTEVSTAQNGMPGMEQGVPGLELKNLTFSDDKPMEDDEILITVIIAGNGTPINNMTIIFTVDNMEVGKAAGQNILPNGSLELSVTWVARAGTHAVNVSALMEGAKAPVSLGGDEIQVEAKSMGEIWTLIFALVGFGVLIMIATAFPRVLHDLKGSPK